MREVAGRAEARAQLAVEAEVDVGLLVDGAVEGSHRRLGVAAARAHGVGEEHELGPAVVAAGERKGLLPGVLDVVEHEGDELDQPLFVGRRPVGGVGPAAGVDADRVAEEREEVLPGGEAQDEEEDGAADADPQPAEPGTAGCAHAAPVFEVAAPSAWRPAHRGGGNEAVRRAQASDPMSARALDGRRFGRVSPSSVAAPYRACYARPMSAPLVACLDLEGVLVPEIWIGVADATGIAELRRTTRDEPDYDRLMRGRLAILEREGLGLADIQKVIAGMRPLDGAPAFLDWLRARAQVIILSDTFMEFAQPLMAQLGFPTLFCNTLVVDDGGCIRGYTLRIADGKRKAVMALKLLNFRVVAAGDSYNDTTMLDEADSGILFRPPDNVVRDFPQFPVTRTYDELRAAFAAADRRTS
ncbi:MAG: phosphoserine phosphatase [Polyangiaceae bacterium UTPRO1]|nr:MAG: phosphoserine phosphatase [Polyangiaceae bacterium UTPRO1]